MYSKVISKVVKDIVVYICIYRLVDLLRMSFERGGQMKERVVADFTGTAQL
jgi:hypothetical protein